MNSSVRMVKCPRCRGVLQEPTGVPVYECGGCGAKLQAKKRNTSAADTSSQRPDENASGKQKVDQVFVDQEATSSSANQQPMLNSTNESDQNSDHNNLHISNKDQDAAKLAENVTVGAQNQSPVNPSDEPDQNVHSDPRTLTEYFGHEDLESSPEATAHNITDHEQQQAQKQDQSQTTQLLLVNSMNELDRNNEHNEHRISSERSYHEDLESSPEPEPEPTVHDRVKQYETKFIRSSNKDLDAAAKVAENSTVHVPNQQSPVNPSDEPEPDQNVHSDPRTSTEYSGHEDPESSPEATTHNITDQQQQQTQKQDQIHSESDSSPTQLLLVNSLDHNKHCSSELSYHEEPDSSPEPTVDPVKPHETEIEEPIANTDGHNRSKPSFSTITHPEQQQNQKQPENETFVEREQQNTAQLSDDNESVESGNRSTLHNRFKHKHKQHETETEESIANTSFRSIIADKLLDTKQKQPMYLYEDDLLSESETETADLRHRRRSGRRRHGGGAAYDGNDNLNPRKHKSGSINNEYVDSGSNHRFNRRIDTHRSRNVRSIHDLKYRSPMIPENPRSERIELLKLVRELQEQLERTNVANLHHGGFRRGYGERTAFSGEATAARDGGACKCRNCNPQNGYFSAQLHDCCYRPNSYHSLRFSSPLSPKQAQVKAQEQYYGFDDHWQWNEVMKVRKPFVSPKKKRYVRPIAGGSPWVACYMCSKLLQLPESFLVSDKRYHSLRCGACLKVLKFTVLEGSRVVRYYPEEMIAAPPSSEVDGPVSCSDRSFEKSYSTETDRYGSREFGEERGKGVLLRDVSGLTRPGSVKVLGRRTGTEIEEVEPGKKGSPLHWLMGYASPSKVIRGL